MAETPEIITFGCRLNAYESEVIRGHLDANNRNDIVVINTCAVTAEAERQARQAIRKVRRKRPETQIVVTGCAAQIDPEMFSKMPEVNRVIGNLEKMAAESYGSSATIMVNDIMSIKETAGHLIQGFANKARAFVQVQQGCDHRCTFCIIPFGRGNSRSVAIGEIVRQISELTANGYSEVVLSGIDISSYGSDLPGRPNLGQMVRRLLSNAPDLRRLRISSIDCIEIDDDLKRVIAQEERLMPHLHLSLQSGNDTILKRMKRRHDRAQAVALCNELRDLRPDIVFGADLIAGFPTETEEMFADTLDLVEECGLTWLHVFPYSERPGTPAARMPQVSKAEKKQRAARLREVGNVAAQHFLETRVGRNEEVLIETATMGRTPQFAPVRLDGNPELASTVSVQISAVENNVCLLGKPVARQTK